MVGFPYFETKDTEVGLNPHFFWCKIIGKSFTEFSKPPINKALGKLSGEWLSLPCYAPNRIDIARRQQKGST